MRNFTASTITLAIEQVRETLGEDAIILSTRHDPEHGVHVTAACDDRINDDDDDDTHPATQQWFTALNAKHTDVVPINPQHEEPPEKPSVREHPFAHFEYVPPPSDNIANDVRAETIYSGEVQPEIVASISQILHYHGVDNVTMQHMMRTLSSLSQLDIQTHPHYSSMAERWMDALMAASFPPLPLPLRHDSGRYLFIGASGVGKTLTTAKIASYCVKHRRPVHVISTDNKRAGGVEQLAAITDILGITLQVADNKLALARMLSDIPLAETVLIDSSGINPYDVYEVRELGHYTHMIEVTPILVMPAGTDPYEAPHHARAFADLGAKHAIVTRIDTARRFGSILNAAYAAKLQFSHMTASEKILGSLDVCSSEYLTRLIMDYPCES
ncbi:MAG: hypothetical protein EAZ74_02150 [Alphaproteobacteria bacterium]|nr:MAG: hypothetical protein EAY76_02325 [Alphaproteobacteria bacterium]TAF15222.1 MAG: hypothetical protein EAZ74_02150 [Alphaproteobacteria bacterium]TAF38650.1 MAG: hypothetical protein EAZ66_06080 [Alphaproteobacteria bacterium]TAF76296.1 MAG: hypothetical protein EAZ52_04415 [Alphaproteobacteria bacterium]